MFNWFHRTGVLVAIMTMLTPYSCFAEGTKQLRPDSTYSGDIWVTNGAGYSCFATETCGPDQKLYVHIARPGEKIFIGFSADSLSVLTLTFKLKLNGIAVFTKTVTMTNGHPGYIRYYSQAVAGPVVLDPKGYLPVDYAPAQPGDYSIDFQLSGSFPGIGLSLFDVTVIDTTKSPLEAIDGRLWSREWGFNTYDVSVPANAFLARQYILTDDSVVTSVDYNHMQGWNFDVTSTSNGCYPPPDPWDSSCRSRAGNHHYAQYRIFINDPDPAEYPTGTLGFILGDSVSVVPACNGTFAISFRVNKPGRVKLNMEVNPAPGIQPEDVTLNRIVTAGFNTIFWNGRNGMGIPIPCGDSVGITMNYINGLTNLALYDVEKHLDGFIIQQVRPDGIPLTVYWNDTLLAGLGGIFQSSGCNFTPPSNGCHSWNGDETSGLGNANTVNSWWYAATSIMELGWFRVACVPPAPDYITGPGFICRDKKITYTVQPNPLPGCSPPGYEWVVTDESTGLVLMDTLTGPVLSCHISDPGISSVNIKVRGYSSRCGYGPYGPQNGGTGIQLHVYPTPEITNPVNAFTICSGDTTNILLQSSMPGTIFSYTSLPTSPSIMGQLSGTENPVRQVLVNNGSTVASVLYKVIPYVDPCAGEVTTFTVRVNPVDTVIFPLSVSENPACTGSEVIFSIPLFSGSPGSVYDWQVNGTSRGDSSVFSYVPVKGDKIKCILSSPDLCNQAQTGYTEEVTMDVLEKLPVSMTLSPDRNPVCPGETVTLTAGTINQGSSPAYQWKINTVSAGNAGYSTYTYVPADSDIVSCLVISGLPCVINREASDSVLIRLQGDHKVVDTLLCYGTSYFAGGKWRDTEGTYFDTLTPPVSCIRILETKLKYKPSIPDKLGNDTTVCGSAYLLNAGIPGASYLWQDGSYDSVFLVTGPGLYRVIITYDGCSQEDSILFGECSPVLWIPNAFTPNGDGLNDRFSVRGLGVEEFSMRIFDRWGKVIFETGSLDQGWDGNYQGSRCLEGTYVYVITFKGSSGAIRQEKGTILLTR